MAKNCNGKQFAEQNPDCFLFTTKDLFVTPIALTSNYNFWTFWTLLECFYMILINKKKFGKNLRTLFFDFTTYGQR